jgi:hypothetical protein
MRRRSGDAIGRGAEPVRQPFEVEGLSHEGLLKLCSMRSGVVL